MINRLRHSFQILGLKSTQLDSITNLSEQELKSRGIKKFTVDANPGYPCRLTLEDAKVGEEVLLFSYEHHNVDSPYRASGPVFMRTNGQEANLEINTIPKMLDHRLLSLRVYDQHSMMIDAETTKGDVLQDSIQSIFDNQNARYIQVHNAGPGCYNCQVNRV